MDGDDLTPNEEPELTPEAQQVLDAFDKLMKGVSDPVESGYAVIAEMFHGLVVAGMRRADAALMVASYVALHDYMGINEEDKS